MAKRQVKKGEPSEIMKSHEEEKLSRREPEKLIEAKGRIIKMGRSKVWLYIPAQVRDDSQFPFQVPEDVNVKIDVKNKRIVIEPMKK
jgi:hypothetical protein